MPNEIFSLGLSVGEIAVYAYLLKCENRKTYNCYPSYKNIAGSLNLCQNSVRKYVAGLEDKHLIETEPTTVTLKSGAKRNGNLFYTIRPINEAVETPVQKSLREITVCLLSRKHTIGNMVITDGKDNCNK